MPRSKNTDAHPRSKAPAATPVPAPLFSVGDVVKQTGEPIHRVRYILAHRRIEPALRVAGARLFTQAQVDEIAAALKASSRD